MRPFSLMGVIMAWMTVTSARISVKTKNLTAEKRKQDHRKQQLVKKLKEIAERKKNGVSVPVRGL